MFCIVCVLQYYIAHAILNSQTIYELGYIVIIRFSQYIHTVCCLLCANSIRIYDDEWFDLWKIIICHVVCVAYMQRHHIKFIFNGNSPTASEIIRAVFLLKPQKIEHTDNNIEFLSSHRNSSYQNVTYNTPTQKPNTDKQVNEIITRKSRYVINHSIFFFAWR